MSGKVHLLSLLLRRKQKTHLTTDNRLLTFGSWSVGVPKFTKKEASKVEQRACLVGNRVCVGHLHARDHFREGTHVYRQDTRSHNRPAAVATLVERCIEGRRIPP